MAAVAVIDWALATVATVGAIAEVAEAQVEGEAAVAVVEG
jgi:hypothetical protein